MGEVLGVTIDMSIGPIEVRFRICGGGGRGWGVKIDVSIGPIEVGFRIHGRGLGS